VLTEPAAADDGEPPAHVRHEFIQASQIGVGKRRWVRTGMRMAFYEAKAEVVRLLDEPGARGVGQLKVAHLSAEGNRRFVPVPSRPHDWVVGYQEPRAIARDRRCEMSLEKLHLQLKPRLEHIIATLPAHLLGKAVTGLEFDHLSRGERALIVVRIDLDYARRHVPTSELRDLLGGDGRRGPLVDGSLGVDEIFRALSGAVLSVVCSHSSLHISQQFVIQDSCRSPLDALSSSMKQYDGMRPIREALHQVWFNLGQIVNRLWFLVFLNPLAITEKEDNSCPRLAST